MAKKSKRLATSLLIPAAPPDAVFHRADILYALEWAAAAPGIGGWNVLLDDEQQTRQVSVVTERLESSMGEEWALDRWGLTVRKISRTFARSNQLTDDTGVIVLGVQPGFPADVAGLQPGDIVTSVNRQPITSLDVIKGAHRNYSGKPAPTLLEVERDRRATFFLIKP